MNNFQIFGLQFTLSTLVYALIARWYIAPILARLPLREALPPLLLTHALRGLGLTVLVTAVVSPEVPRAFATQVAYGDLLANGIGAACAGRRPGPVDTCPGARLGVQSRGVCGFDAGVL